MTQQPKETIQLEITPTIFPDFNVKHNLPPHHETTQIPVGRIKHGHLRRMQQLNQADQIHYLMTELTGLSQSDLDELDVDDSAKLSQVIFDLMKRFAELAKQIK